MLVLVAGHNLEFRSVLHLVWYPKTGEIMLRFGNTSWNFADDSFAQDTIARYINPATNLPFDYEG